MYTWSSRTETPTRTMSAQRRLRVSSQTTHAWRNEKRRREREKRWKMRETFSGTLVCVATACCLYTCFRTASTLAFGQQALCKLHSVSGSEPKRRLDFLAKVISRWGGKIDEYGQDRGAVGKVKEMHLVACQENNQIFCKQRAITLPSKSHYSKDPGVCRGFAYLGFGYFNFIKLIFNRCDFRWICFDFWEIYLD